MTIRNLLKPLLFWTIALGLQGCGKNVVHQTIPESSDSPFAGMTTTQIMELTPAQYKEKFDEAECRFVVLMTKRERKRLAKFLTGTSTVEDGLERGIFKNDQEVAANLAKIYIQVAYYRRCGAAGFENISPEEYLEKAERISSRYLD